MAIKRITRNGVRDWSVSASLRDGSDQVEMVFKCGKNVAGQPVTIPVDQWPELIADQQNMMLKAIGSQPEDEGFYQSIRLADEARKAVSELVTSIPKADKALKPWEKSRL